MTKFCFNTSENDDRGQHPGNHTIAGVTGVILAGGASSRMGTNKALMKVGEQTLIERVYATMAVLFPAVIVVTNTPDCYAFLSCPMAGDIYPGFGSIAGLHAGLCASGTERIFVAACDMPFLNPALIRLLCRSGDEYDAVVPLNSFGLREPLHALYAKSALAPLQQAIEAGNKSILHVLDRMRTRLVSNDEFRSIAGAEESFRNVNTMEEFVQVTELIQVARHACDCARQ